MKNINTILKDMNGSVLGIGLDDNFSDILNKNNKISECYLLNHNGNSTNDGKSYSRVIRINRLKRVFRKKSFDYIVGNIDDLKLYLRTFIKNSIYLNRNRIYFYGSIDSYDLDELEYRYKRYGCKIDKNISANSFILEIDNGEVKSNLLLNIRFRIRDIFYDFFEYISDLLIK